MASGIGATVAQLADANPVPLFFGEDQGRYLVTINLDPQGEGMMEFWDDATSFGINAPWIGTTGGSELKLGDARAIAVADLRAAHESWFPAYMSGDLPPAN